DARGLHDIVANSVTRHPSNSIFRHKMSILSAGVAAARVDTEDSPQRSQSSQRFSKFGLPLRSLRPLRSILPFPTQSRRDELLRAADDNQFLRGGAERRKRE